MIRQYTIVTHADGKEYRFTPYDNYGYTANIKKGLKKGKVTVTDYHIENEYESVEEYEVNIDSSGYVIKK
jgi:hypothetical protein